jgi:hypothetical protein
VTKDTPPSPVWKKSSFSGANGCVEVCVEHRKILLRDSKDKRGPVLAFTPVEWVAFLGGVRSGEFDVP